MAGCKNLFAVLVASCALATQAQENTAQTEKKSPRDTTPYVMLTVALPLACARIYPAMAEKAAAVEAGFTAHFDTPAAKESWSQGSILPPDATEEMKRARQARIDAAWQKMAAETHEMFAPERITCLVSHMQLNRAQCQTFVDAFADAKELKQDAAQMEKDMRALDGTIIPCMPLVTNWPGKNDRLR